jgi:lactate 2-monooxygenase
MGLQSEKIQMNRYQAGDEAAKLPPVSFDEWEKKARAILSASPYGDVYSPAGLEDTNRANVEAFQNYLIRPRVPVGGNESCHF